MAEAVQTTLNELTIKQNLTALYTTALAYSPSRRPAYDQTKRTDSTLSRHDMQPLNLSCIVWRKTRTHARSNCALSQWPYRRDLVIIGETGE